MQSLQPSYQEMAARCHSFLLDLSSPDRVLYLDRRHHRDGGQQSLLQQEVLPFQEVELGHCGGGERFDVL